MFAFVFVVPAEPPAVAEVDIYFQPARAVKA